MCEQELEGVVKIITKRGKERRGERAESKEKD